MSQNGSSVVVVDPRTGESKPLAPEEAQAGFVNGQLQLPNGVTVPLAHADGTIADVDANKIPDLLKKGWNFANRQQVAKADVEASPMLQVQGAAEGALSALTFGGSDVALKHIFNADMDAVNAARQTTAGKAGTGLGIAASIIGPGLVGKLGAGIAKTGLEAALMPSMALNAGTEALEQAAMKALPAALNAGVKGAIASGGARALEGAAVGIGGQLSEAALGNSDANAENILASGGMGALIGAVAGGSMGGLRGFFSGRATSAAALPASPEDFAAAARASGIEMSDAAAKHWWPDLRKVAMGLGDLGGYDKGQVGIVQTPYARSMLLNIDSELEKNARGMVGAVNSVLENQDEARKIVFGELKGSALETLIPKAAQGPMLKGVADSLDSVTAELNGIKRDWAKLGFRSEASAEGAVGAFEQQLKDIRAKMVKGLGLSEREAFDEAVTQPGIRTFEPSAAPSTVLGQEAGTLPNVGGEYFYHATPASNLDNIVEQGLKPREGGKNFAFKKNRDVVYFSGADEAPMWAQKLRDVAGEDVVELRTKAGTKGVEGANKAVRIRDKTVVPERLEVKVNGEWQPLKLPPVEQAELAEIVGQNASLALNKFDEAATIPGQSLYQQSRFEGQGGSLQQQIDRIGRINPKVAQDVFQDFNALKQRLQSPARFAEEIGDAGQRQLQGRFQAAHRIVKDNLEDVGTWGEAGELQKKLNSAFGQREEAVKRLEKLFGIDPETGKISSGAMMSYVQKMSKVRGDDAVEALNQWRGADQQWSEAVESMFPARGLKAASSKVHTRLEKELESLDRNVSINTAMEGLRKQHSRNYGIEHGAMAGLVAGGVVGGPVGAAAGWMAGKALNKVGQAIFDPSKFALAAANVQRLNERYGRAVSSWANKMSGAAETAIPPLPAGRVLTRATSAMLTGNREERQEGYTERLKELQGMADPDKFSDNARLVLGDMADQLPDHTSSAVLQAQRAASYLLAQVPYANVATAPTGTGSLFANPQPQPRDVLRYAQIEQAVQAPSEVLYNAAMGKALLNHQWRAIEAVYPQVAQNFRQELMQAVAASGKAPSGPMRQTIDLILGSQVPPAVARKRQELHAPKPAEGPKPSGKPASPASMLTGSQAAINSYPSLPQ